MSMKIKGRSAVDSLVEIQQGFSQVVTTSNDSIESRINSYLGVLQEKKANQEIPKVAYKTSKVLLSCQNICQRINCFSHCRFFNRETTNIYITPQNDGGIFLSSPRSIEGFDQQDNQLTNTTFFVHLYDQFNDHLPYIFSVALKTLPEEIKKFWERWDPNSTEQLEKGKAKRLLKVLSEAEEVYKEVRKEIMKKDLLKKIQGFSGLGSGPSFKLTPHRLEPLFREHVSDPIESAAQSPSLIQHEVQSMAVAESINYLEPLNYSQDPVFTDLIDQSQTNQNNIALSNPPSPQFRRDEASDLTQLSAYASESLDRRESRPTTPILELQDTAIAGAMSVDQGHVDSADAILSSEVGEEVVFAKLQIMPDRVQYITQDSLVGVSFACASESQDRIEVAQTAISPSLAPHMSSITLDSSKKYVEKKGIFVEFSKKVLSDDLLKVTKCSKNQADEIAQEIEDWIELTTTTQEIWDQLVIILKTKNIRIRGALRSKLGEEVEDMLDRIELSDVDAIPHEEFLELLKAKNAKKSMFCSANPAPKSPSKPIRREREDVIAQCRSLDFGERSGNLLRQNTVRISDV